MVIADPNPADDALDDALGVFVLGVPLLRVGGRSQPFPSGRPGRLLASLLVARGRVVTVDRLVDDVWGEEPPADARAALHTTVGRARRSLAPHTHRLEHSPAGYRLDLAGVDLDADRFVATLGRARSLQGEAAVSAYDEGLRLWRGPAWAGVTEAVVRGDALRLEEAHLAAREERAAALLSLGRAEEVVGELRALVAEHPLRDRPALLLMRGLHDLGAAADALAVFAGHRQALAEELGLDPSPELVEAQRAVLERTPSSHQPRAPAPPAQEPARPTGAPSPQPRHGLVGRDNDVARIRDLTGRHRCVTVVGPGGVGKTAVARAVADAEPTCWWVDLSSVTTEAGVRAITATALGVEVFPGGSPEAALHRRLETAEGLLVLDNCEHVVGAVGDLVMGVARHGPGVRVLATSRERLGLTVEQVFPLAPLRLPGAGDLDADVPSVALFLERARAADPALEPTPDVVRAVAELVRRLDGLPLAIELAASRVGVVDLTTLRERLDGRLDLLRSHHRRGPARHQTLADTIDWSYDLLDPDQQRALRRLSVFAGPFELDAAEAVLGPDSTEHVLGLVERSLLVRPGQGRRDYRMLETVRAFARAHLDDAEREEAHAAHARWAAAAAVQAQAGVDGPDAAHWMGRVENLLPETARAIEWAIEAGHVDDVVRAVVALYPWAYHRVRADVMGWGHRLLQSGHPAAVTPDVLAVASTYWWMIGDAERATEQADRGIELAGGQESPAAFLALNAAGDVALAVGDLEKAHSLLGCAHRLALETQDWNGVVVAESGQLLSRIYGQQDAPRELELLRTHQSRAASPHARALGLYAEAEAVSAHDPERALALFGQARELARKTGSLLVLGVSLASETALLGRVASLDEVTLSRTADAVRFWIGSGNTNLFVTCLRNVVSVLDRLDAHRAVVEVVATTTAQAPDRPSYGVEATHLESALARSRKALGAAEFDEAWHEGVRRDLDAAGEAVVARLVAALAPSGGGTVSGL